MSSHLRLSKLKDFSTAKHYQSAASIPYGKNNVSAAPRFDNAVSLIIFRSYIIEDLVTGGDLVSYIERKGGRLHDLDACAITYQILKALQHLHGQNIVHRDIKPENVLLNSVHAGARAILADFGQAIKLSDDITHHAKRMQTVCGTLDWVAP